MPTAQIKVNGTLGGNKNLPISTPVALATGATSGETSWLWSLDILPTGSTATVSTPTASTAAFTPDVTGTYGVHLTLNGTLHARVICAVLLPNTSLREIGSGEDVATWLSDWTYEAGAVARKIESWFARILPVASTVGRIVYDTGTAWVALAAGTNGKVLTAHTGAAPTWETPSVDPYPFVVSTPTITHGGAPSQQDLQIITGVAEGACGTYIVHAIGRLSGGVAVASFSRIITLRRQTAGNVALVGAVQNLGDRQVDMTGWAVNAENIDIATQGYTIQYTTQGTVQWTIIAIQLTATLGS